LHVDKGVLTGVGNKREQEDSNVTYLHQGIARREFKLSFWLADNIEVKGAVLSYVLLSIDLVRNVPEEDKPKRIPLNTQ
ncbi:Hsp20 family protein, partial [Pseudomonas syringae group genomosp. 7]|uniref:Hsp20 family protein n=1 Tax=Pseudomonas syringae group genomosp. 7 TaxID=251699 RepID=UPI00376F92D6